MKKIIFKLLIIHCSFFIANAQWVVISDTSMRYSADAFADCNNNLYTIMSGLGVYKTTNLGNNWTLTGTGLTYQPLNNLSVHDSIIFVSSNYGLYRSTNNGATWDSLTNIPGSVFSVINVNNYVYAGTLSGIKRSSDWGNSWELINNEIQWTYGQVRYFAYTNNTLYVAMDSMFYLRIYKSTNLGDNWILISQGISPSHHIPYSLYAYDNLLLCGTALGVYKSTNYGINWALISGISGNIGLFGFASVGTKSIFISAWSYGVYVSNDYGESFTLKNDGLQNLRCTALYKFGNYLFLGTNPPYLPCEMYRRPINEVIGINNISTTVPDEYKLFQNYPNPFNPVTKVNYELPKDGMVRLIIYDVLGREIKTLVNEVKQAGRYTVEFNGSGFASGVYFYRIQAGNFVSVKRMVLIK